MYLLDIDTTCCSEELSDHLCPPEHLLHQQNQRGMESQRVSLGKIRVVKMYADRSHLFLSVDGSPKKSTKSSSPPPSSQPITPKTQTTASSQPPSHSPPVANKAAGSEYLVPEYFQHNQDTYADLFVDMARHRLPPPVRPGRH